MSLKVELAPVFEVELAPVFEVELAPVFEVALFTSRCSKWSWPRCSSSRWWCWTLPLLHFLLTFTSEYLAALDCVDHLRNDEKSHNHFCQVEEPGHLCCGANRK